MLDHLGLTVADLGRSQRFYAQALAPLGYAVRAEYAGRFVGFGAGAPKTGTHVAFYCA
jgi:catechol 2,3-dioxygenase-like lactoylglutathione lyase family enzyme